jgi:hypothetical protein
MSNQVRSKMMNRRKLTLSRISLCSSLTIKIMSKRDKMVVWKSMF